MRQGSQTAAVREGTNDPSLAEQVAEAVDSASTPISRLLRLMWALDAEPEADAGLRDRLRHRIGAPLGA